MPAAHRPFVLIKRVAAPAIGFLVIGYFVAAAVAGDNGVLSWGEYRAAKAEREAELQKLKSQEDWLAHRAKLLDPRATDPDLSEEITRRELGVVRPDEVVVPLE